MRSAGVAATVLALALTSALAAGPLTPAAGAADPQAHATSLGPAPASRTLRLVLPLRADVAGLARFASAVSSPGSPLYGEFEPVDRLARRFGASMGTRRRVLSFLTHAGARDVGIDVTGLFAEAAISTALAERLFATPLLDFRSATGSRYTAPAALPASAVRIPPALRGLVTTVIGLDTRPLTNSSPAARGGGRRTASAASQASSLRARSGTPTGCAAGIATGGFAPNQYLTAYGYDPLHSAGVAGQGERVALIEVDGFRLSDIEAFASCFGLPIPALNGFGVGVPRPLAPGEESTLDLELLDAAAPGLESIDVYETRPTAADTLQALTAPLRARHRPQVISASLGLCEPALLRSVGRAGIQTTESALQIAAASGITFLAASGDQGSADCPGIDGLPLPLLSVNYPASSWWVTGVGGTNLVLGAVNQIVQQVVWNDAAEQPGSAGGGGSSVLFRRPDYQQGAVRSDARAVPDLAMLADVAPGYAIYCTAAADCINSGNSNPWQTVGGTSAGTPLLAGGIALIDQELRFHQRDNLGLLTPLLYSAGRSHTAASVFYDVTQIGNDVGPDIAGGRPLGCCQAGRGFDRASGWGSVNLTALAGFVLAHRPAANSIGLSLPAGQRPVHSRELRATVACSAACRIGAYASIAIGRGKPFEIDSTVVRLGGRGRRTLALRLSTPRVRSLRSALAAHRRIRATVFGVLFDPTVYGVLPDPGQAIQKRTPGRQLSIAG